jgi:hypothetical protein
MEAAVNPAILWGLCAGIPAVAAEYLYRTLPGPWHHYLWLWVPIQMAIGYSIYRLVTIPGTSLLDAMVVWAFCTAGLRVLISLGLGDDIKTGTWIAFGLVLLATAIKTYWRT